MSWRGRLAEKALEARGGALTEPPKPPSVSFVSTQEGHLRRFQGSTPCKEIGREGPVGSLTKPTKGNAESEDDSAPTSPELTPGQELARRQVIARLEANATVQRAFETRFEGDVLIVTLAVRGVGTCELQIASDRFDRTNPADPVALINCLTNAEGTPYGGLNDPREN